MLFIQGVINLAADLVEHGETVRSAVDKALYQVSDHSEKGQTEVAGEISHDLFMKQKHVPFLKNWDQFLNLSPKKKLEILVKNEVQRRNAIKQA